VLRVANDNRHEKTYLSKLETLNRFGKINLVTSPASSEPLSKLGPDALLDMPTLDGFSELMLKQGRPLKAVLLDQSVLSGIGNWVADEVCENLCPKERCPAAIIREQPCADISCLDTHLQSLVTCLRLQRMHLPSRQHEI
jgi:formamidopyrimidine-DNA glycosylase